MTYAEIKEKVEKFGHNLPISAENENAEYVIIGEGYELHELNRNKVKK